MVKPHAATSDFGKPAAPCRRAGKVIATAWGGGGKEVISVAWHEAAVGNMEERKEGLGLRYRNKNKERR